MKRKDRHASIKRLTFCAMLVALGVIFLGIGALIEVLDISMAVIASICVIIPMIEYGKGTPWMVYAAISVLSLLLLPNKFPAALFALFAGFYPILKEKLERKNTVIRWILKELIFNISLAIIVLLYFFLFFKGTIQVPWMIAVAIILAELVFILYDKAISKLIRIYVMEFRHRLKFK
jgi:hypothetical protein